MKPGRILAIVFGALSAVVATAMLIAGAVLVGAYATQRDSDGFFVSGNRRITSSTYALTSDRIDLHLNAAPLWLDESRLARVKVRARSTDGRPVFVGIAREADVERYLAGVAHDEVTNIHDHPFRVTKQLSPGDRTPAPPSEQSFWVARSSGTGTRTARWSLKSGTWAVVVMNADARRAVRSDIAIGVTSSLFGPVVAVLLALGAAGLAVGVGLILFGASGLGRRHAASAPVPEPVMTHQEMSDGRNAAPRSPVRIEGRLDEPLSRWLWLVKWLLLIPHLVVLVFLWIAWFVLTVVAGVSILFTGTYPARIFDFNLGVLRWTWRVQFYGLSALATDRYPPFSLEREDGYPATLDIERPTRLSRGLVLVKWWLLAIPHYLIVGVFTAGVAWSGTQRQRYPWRLSFSGGLIGVSVCIAGVILLFRRQYPQGIFDFVMGMNRWVYRVIAYAGLMTDRYPPLRFDGGGSEMTVPPPSTPAAPTGSAPAPTTEARDTVGV